MLQYKCDFAFLRRLDRLVSVQISIFFPAHFVSWLQIMSQKQHGSFCNDDILASLHSFCVFGLCVQSKMSVEKSIQLIPENVAFLNHYLFLLIRFPTRCMNRPSLLSAPLWVGYTGYPNSRLFKEALLSFSEVCMFPVLLPLSGRTSSLPSKYSYRL